KENKKGFWRHVGNIVEKRPGMIAVIVLVVFGIGAMNMLTMNFSFNMLKSFPEDMSSRQGFETLEEEYPPGQLAPMDIVLTSEEPFDFDEELRANIEKMITQIEQTSGIDSVSPHLTDEMIDGSEDLPDDFVSESGKSVRMQVVIDGNPYEKDALATVESIREQEKDMLTNYHFSPEVYALHIAGQTAEQLDVKQMNKRDMILLFSLVTVLLTLVLGFQTKSVLMPILMMGTILLSYGASLGIGWFM